MTLPASRSITINDGDPIPAWIINLLEDMHIGAKHPEIERGIAACAFVGSGITALGGEQLNFTSVNGVVYAPVVLPVGDRITTVKWGYLVGASATLTWSLRRRLVDGSAAEETITPVSGTTTDTTPGGAESAVVTYNHVIASGYVYTLQFSAASLSGTSNLYGATVKHDNL